MKNYTAYWVKKISALFFALVVFLTPSAAFAATLSLSPATQTVNKNCTFQVRIELNTQGQDTDGTDVELAYDASKFSVTTSSIVNGTIYSDYPGNSVTGGVIKISGIAPAAQPYSGTGTFATLNVSVLSSASGTGTFKFAFDPNDKTKTTDTNVVQGGVDPTDILTQVTDGTYTVGTGTGCTGSSTGTGTGSGGTTGGGTTGGVRTLPAGNTGTGGTLGNGPLSGGPATDSGLIYKELPQGGLEGPTLIFVAVGGVLTVLGFLGLALL